MSKQQAPFVTDPRLTNIAVAYINEAMIADRVMPRTPVGQREFRYLKYEQEERFTVPNTRVGRKSRTPEVEFGAGEATGSVEDYGLEDAIPQQDVDNAPEGYDPIGHATEAMTDLVMLDREIRVANIVHDPATYPASNKVDLSNSTQWSDYTNSDPIGDIHKGQDTLLADANIAVVGHQAWRTLSRHPEIIKAIHGNSGDSGVATRDQVAELLELDEIIVGRARMNTARPGQAANFKRVWGDHFALLHRNNLADTRQGVTFAMSPVFGDRVAMQKPDDDIGLRGGTRVRTGESIGEVVVAPDVGYLLQDVTA